MDATITRRGSVLLLAGMLLLPTPAAHGQSAPLCFGLSPDAARAQGYNVLVSAAGAGGDTITGTDGRDLILGSAGPDRLDGRGGDDLICGKGGNDYITGGAGADRLKGGGGNDAIGGDNVLTGSVTGTRSFGADVSGNGTAGNDVLAGGANNDFLIGNAGDDILRGRTGDDGLDIDPEAGGFRNSPSGAGRDSLDGGDGNDRCSSDTADAPSANCELGPTQ